MRKKIYNFLTIFFVINIVIILYSSTPAEPPEFKIKNNSSIGDDWKVEVGVNSKGKEIVSLENIIYKTGFDEPYVLITTHIPVDIYIDDRLVKSFLDTKKCDDTEVGSIAWRILKLPEDCFGKKIRFEFEEADFRLLLKEFRADMGSYAYEMKGVMIGTEQELLTKMILANIKYVFIASVFIITAVVLVCLYFIARIKYRHKTNCCYVSAGLFCFACWLVCDSQLLMFLFNNITVYHIKCICIFSIPIVMIIYTEVEFETRNKKYIGILGIFQTTLAVITMALHAFSIISINLLTQIMWGMFFTNEFLCIVLLLPDIDKSTRVRNLFRGHLIAYITVYMYFSASFQYVRDNQAKYLSIGFVFFFVYFLIIVIGKMLRYYDKLYEKAFLKMRFCEETEYYKMVEKNDNILRKIIHDAKNHWRVLEILLSEGKNKEALSYSKEIVDDLNIRTKEIVICTGNSFFDAILTIKIRYAQEKNINVDTEIMVVKNMKIDTIDYSILFGNILDNAIEACENIEDKWIKISIFYKKNMLICKITNSANTQNLSKGIMQTTKKDKLMHGIGIKNVKDVIEKYNGNFDFENASDAAIVRFILYNV